MADVRGKYRPSMVSMRRALSRHDEIGRSLPHAEFNPFSSLRRCGPDDWDMAPAIVRLIESAHDNERLSN
jgi:hypothetical protein